MYRFKQQNWWWAFVAATGVVILDQISKLLAVGYLYGEPISLLPFLTLRFLCNPGAAFSILQGFTGFLTVVSVVFVLFFSWEIWRLRRMTDTHVLYPVALSLILGGAAGNLIDRAFRGCVVDFLHVHYDWFNFPVFNIADSAVCIGAACWIVVAFITREKKEISKTATEDSAD